MPAKITIRWDHLKTLNMNLKLPLVLGAIAVSSTALADGGPGSRTDVTPWFGYGSLNNKIINDANSLSSNAKDLASDIAKQDQYYKKKRAQLEGDEQKAGYFGLPFITDSRSDYREAIANLDKNHVASITSTHRQHAQNAQNLTHDLKDALASPPGKKARNQSQKIEKGTASHEAQEVYNAESNLESTVSQLQQQLASNPHNYALAVKDYKTQIRLIRVVISMNQQFKYRVRSVYRPKFKSLLIRTNKQLATLDENTTLSKMGKKDEKHNMHEVMKSIHNSLPTLTSYQKIASNNITSLQHQIDSLQIYLKDAGIVRDASALVSKINANTHKLHFNPPKIIPYDLKKSDLHLNAPNE